MSDTPKMNPEVKAKWVEALRSGDYSQCKNYLRSEATGGFCCLGVLSDVFQKETGKGEWKTERDANSNQDFYRFIPNEGSWGSTIGLVQDVRDWSGLVSVETTINLANKNDDGVSFADIANYIEKVL
jgi:hypothetical protein